jgi:nitroreductase
MKEIMKTEAFETILTRKSIRSFKQKHVTDEQIEKIILAGTRAPSGMANEPWRFAVIRDNEVKTNISKLTKHTDTINEADALICLFMDNDVGYDAVKDANTIGACAENMLLAAHALGLGAVWIAEIRRNKDQVAIECGVDMARYDLMVVLPIGYSDEDPTPTPRKRTMEEVILSKK